MTTPTPHPEAQDESAPGVQNRTPDDQEPTDEQLRSQEAANYRRQRNEAQAHGAELVQQVADANARARAAERQVVNQHLAGRLADPEDFWRESDLAQLRDDAGGLDLGLVDARADELLSEHPHWAGLDPRVPTLAPAGTVGSGGLIGAGPRSVLDVENVLASPARGWAGFLGDAARGEATTPPSA
jgi:hypothetical protein